MGENSDRVYRLGAPGVDEITSTELIPIETLYEKYNLIQNEPFLLLLQHAVTNEEVSISTINETLIAVKSLKIPTIIIYPNVDAGGRKIINLYKKLESEPYISVYPNLPRKDYLSLMKYAACMVGNSSSGIIEAPYFCLPVVNIGSRQRDRERAKNVIDVKPDANDIIKGIEKALSDNFVETLNHIEIPYGDGGVGERIARVLARINIDDYFMNKRATF
jgi:UDP-hydrolysing UDP-N-acetyl-D-glucosamine 2-epimerase